jgi:hypothetical protein
VVYYNETRRVTSAPVVEATTTVRREVVLDIVAIELQIRIRQGAVVKVEPRTALVLEFATSWKWYIIRS